MLLFEAFMKDGSCVSGDNWDKVRKSTDIDCLIVHHPWNPNVSVVMTKAHDYFLWKEAIGKMGFAGDIVKIGFGKRLPNGSVDSEIHFLRGGGIATPSHP
jgi:hypothetical protein